MYSDPANTTFQLALQFVNQTSRTIFLTGKAGTGKTTFLKYVRENSFKKMAVVAPTGVAAINAGGVTMHSFFQLPFGPYIPSQQTGWKGESPGYSDPSSLFKNIRFNSSKRELLQELELLVIDEISMVRADTLDAIDTILRHFRVQPLLPFGGVQVLYIGDLFQLPPVVTKGEEALLQQYYKSPFFFDAQVIQQAPPIYLELKKIYRQNEAAFINLLNNVRNNQLTQADLNKLDDYYDPGFMSPKGSNYITLTSHNARADDINQVELSKIKGKSHAFEATVTGEFNDKAFPAEKTLQLKEGAQIMLIKNDKGETRRYFNGKIGTIRKLSPDKVTIVFPDEPDELILEKEIWRNIRYAYNKEKDNIEEEELGTFSQYPIRLAWAITIHKSQGLTFEKAIIDAGSSFAAGQVYVALSRLTGLEGMVLRSRIQAHCISTEPRVLSFIDSMQKEEILAGQLQEEQMLYISRSLVRSFDWTKLVEKLRENLEEMGYRQIPDKIKAIELGRQWLDKALKQHETAVKFSRQLDQLLQTAADDGYQQLQQRTQAAAGYFIPALEDDILSHLQQHIQEVRSKKKIKKYLETLNELKLLCTRKKQQLEDALQMVTGLRGGVDTTALLNALQEKKKTEEQPDDHTDEGTEKTTGNSKPKKGDTNRTTLQMFRDGLTPVEISARRGLAQTTIESHLASFIPTGEINIKELVPEDKIATIAAAIEEIGGTALGPIKSRLGDKYSFGEIRSVMYHVRQAATKQESNP